VSLDVPMTTPRVGLASAGNVVACPYCNADVAVEAFTPVNAHNELVTAVCSCGRNLTMATITLQRRSTLHLR